MDFNNWTLEQYKEWLDMCTHCAACFARGPIVPHNWRKLPPHEWQSPLHKCPSFEYYNFKSHTGCGRLLLAAHTFANNAEISDDLINIAYSCTSCEVCNEICIVHKPFNAILALREEINERGLPLPAPLQDIYRNMESTHNMFGLEKRAKNLPALPTEGEDIYFTGCYTSYLLPEIARATIGVLKAGGINIAHLGEAERCCGEMAKQGGNRKLFKEMASHNVEAMKKAGAKRVIVSCAHGYKTWKTHYPPVVGELPFEVLHVSEVIAGLLKEGKIKFERTVNRKVTFHDPCFLRGENEEIREILRSIPGLEIGEMERYGRWSYCCGGGAKITLNCYPDFAAAVGTERVKEAKKAADNVVTSCPICFNQLRYTAGAEGIAITVQDLPVLVAEAMGIEY